MLLGKKGENTPLKSLLQLRKFLAPELIFGDGARLLISRYARNLGAKKALIVTDEGIINAGWLMDVLNSLGEYDIDYVIYSDITPNPRGQEVMEGSRIYLDEGCNLIIAIGGGSPIDCAKAIGIVSTNPSHITEFEGIDKIDTPIPPLLCIPTTAGSSADVSQFAIILDMERKVKMAITSKTLVPDIALIDPKTLTTMNPYLTACTGMDALTHAIEAYVSKANSVFSNLFALEAIKIITGNLKQFVEDPLNVDFCGQAMLGSLYAGIAFSNASLGAVHAMAHSLGGLLDKAHGECNAILLEHVISANFDSAPSEYKMIGQAMGLDLKNISYSQVKDKLIQHIKDVKYSIGIKNTLKDIGLNRDMIPTLAEYSQKDICMATNPKFLTQDDIEVIFKNAY